MKRIAENRYPHSATLFKFCKEALSLRFEPNVKVIDQDVGAILSYDPADCSHWKKGKKNIRSLTTLKNLASYLQIDERILIEIASGKMDLEEAVFEYKGYGNFEFQGQRLENFKKDFFKNPEKWQKDGRNRSFEELFSIKREAIMRVAEALLKKGSFHEAPIYVPELYNNVRNMELLHEPGLSKSIQVDYSGTGDSLHATIRYRDKDMRPYVRFQLVKELFFFLCKSNHELARDFTSSPEEILDIQANIFSGAILVPAYLLRKEVERLDCTLDVVSQLTQTFWISKALMNRRLSDYIDNLN